MPDSRLSKRDFRRRGRLRRMSAKPPATISALATSASEEASLRPAAAVPRPARARHEIGTPTGGLRPDVALDRRPWHRDQATPAVSLQRPDDLLRVPATVHECPHAKGRPAKEAEMLWPDPIDGRLAATPGTGRVGRGWPDSSSQSGAAR